MKKLLRIFNCCKKHRKLLIEAPSMTEPKREEKIIEIVTSPGGGNKYQNMEMKYGIAKPDEKGKSKDNKEKNIEAFIHVKIKKVNENSSTTSSSFANVEVVKQDDNDKWLIPHDSNWIYPQERLSIEFSKKGIAAFCDSLSSSSEFIVINNSKNMVSEIKKNGSPFSSDFYLGKSVYTCKKTSFKLSHTLADLIEIMYNPDIRAKWDISCKSVKKYEGNNEAYVIRTIFNSPIMFASEREVIEKRFQFFLNGTFYSFSSSVPDNYFPEEKGIIRCRNFVNICIITSDEENYYFTSLTQSDLKMIIPQSVLRMTMPSKLIEWYSNFIEFANKESA